MISPVLSALSTIKKRSRFTDSGRKPVQGFYQLKQLYVKRCVYL
uniref:Uncharacterized protein n=1 Tax=Klebsiella pneumoniae TaxID=573 RepID=A0A8B0SVP8_KLEPN|nr:hypothetical protein [Klebsiella pneumoniae]